MKPHTSSERPPCPRNNADCPSLKQLADLCETGQLSVADAQTLESVNGCTVCESFIAGYQTASLPDRGIDATLSMSTGNGPLPETVSPETEHGKTHSLERAFGDYQILGEIARGGMGAVFKARHKQIERVVALKVIRGTNPGSQELERFQSEARAAAKLSHSSIVPIYDVGVVDTEPYFTMKFIDGPSLAGRLSGKPIDNRLAASITRDVSDAMSHAHQHGIIHRDLKPGNVLLESDQTPMVTDFGLAKLVDDDSDLTRTGQAIGTPAYMPPEQASGESVRVDHRSDVYSLGAVLYACLTGRPPFQGATPVATVMQVIHEEPAPPRLLNPDVHRDLQTICLKCLSKEPDSRYQSAAELRDDLDRFLSDKPIHARPVSPLERGIKWIRRNPRSVLTAVAGVCTIIGAGVAITASIQSSIMQAAMNENDFRTKAIEKNHQLLKPDTDAYVIQTQTFRDDRTLRLQLVHAALKQNDAHGAFETFRQIERPEKPEFEYHFVGRELQQHSKELQLGFNGDFRFIEYDNGGLWIYARYNYGQILCLDPETFEVRRNYPREKESQTCVRDGERWYMTNFEGDIHTWKSSDEQKPRLLLQLGADHRVAVSSNRLFAIRRYGSPVSLDVFDLNERKNVERVSLDFDVYAMSIDHERNRLYISGGGWKPEPFRVIQTYVLDDVSEPQLTRRESGKPRVRFAKVSGDGSKFFVTDDRNDLWLYEAETLEPVRKIASAGVYVKSMAVTDDGSKVAIGDSLGKLQVFHVESGRRVYVQTAHSGDCDLLCFNNDGTKLYSTSSFSGSLKEWVLPDKQIHAPSLGMTGVLQDAQFSHDGKWLVVCDNDPGKSSTGVALVDRRQQKISDLKAQCELGGTAIWSGFADQGDVCLVVFSDGQIHWYDSQTQELRDTLQLKNLRVQSSRCVALSFDKGLLAVASESGIDLVDLKKKHAQRISSTEASGISFCGATQKLIAIQFNKNAEKPVLNEIDLATEQATLINDAHQDVIACTQSSEYICMAGHQSVTMMERSRRKKLWAIHLPETVIDVAFTREGSRVLVLSYESLYILNSRNGATVLKEHLNSGRFIRLSPTDSTLLIGNQKSLRTMDVRPLPHSDHERLNVPRVVFTERPELNHQLTLPAIEGQKEKRR